MTITDYRKNVAKLTIEELADALELKSKGHLSDIENGKRGCSVAIALALEKHSSGLLDAASLNSDVARARQVAA